MYKYKIGYSTWEESSFVELEHNIKFSQDDITLMVAEAIKDLFPNIIRNGYSSENKKYRTQFDKFWNGIDKNNIVDWLVDSKGFKLIVYDEVWAVDGWVSVVHPSENNTELVKISTYLKEKGIE